MRKYIFSQDVVTRLKPPSHPQITNKACKVVQDKVTQCTILQLYETKPSWEDMKTHTQQKSPIVKAEGVIHPKLLTVC